MTPSADAVYLGLDIGTTSCKAVALGADGAVVATATRAYPLSTPALGWSEQDPEDWWTAVDSCAREVTARLPRRGLEVEGIGLSGQMHGLVALDDHHRVIRPAILWNDQRCAAEVEDIVAEVGGPERVVDETDNRLITGFTAGKVRWLRDHEPEAFSRVHRVLNPKDYVRWRINGRFVTDESEASGTGMFDVVRRQWSVAMATASGVSAAMLPDVVPSVAPTGAVGAEVAQRWNIPAGVEVYGGGGDAVIQTLSMGIGRPGDIGVTLGTAGIVAAVVDEPPDNASGRVQVSCCNRPGRWHVMGVALSGAGSLQWLRDCLGVLVEDLDFDRLVALAQDAPVGSDGLLFLPYLTGERAPNYAPSASAAFVGLTRLHGLGHVVRSVIEGSLLNIREILEVMVTLDIPCQRVVASGGATRSPFWLQSMADVLGRPVVTLRDSGEGGAFGAALVAGVGAGQWPGFDEFFGELEIAETYQPDPERAARYDVVFAGHRRLFGDLADAYADVSVARGAIGDATGPT